MTVPRWLRPASSWWTTIVCLLLTGLVFAHASGRMLPDTNPGLQINPERLLRSGLSTWNAGVGAGAMSTPDISVLFPAAPFFALMHAIGLPAWIAQRLWWSLLITIAFIGVRKLGTRIGVRYGSAATIGALFYVCVLVTFGSVFTHSAAALPMVMLPWMLAPLVDRDGRLSRPVVTRTALARSALAVLLAGAANVAGTLAVLLVPFLWLVARSDGHRSRARSIARWLVTIVLATVWSGCLVGLAVWTRSPWPSGQVSAASDWSAVVPLLALPLALGVGVVAGNLLRAPIAVLPQSAHVRNVQRAMLATIVLAALMTSPLLTGSAFAPARPKVVTQSWKSAGQWLDDHADNRRALIVPGAARPVYVWGEPGGDIGPSVARTPTTTPNEVVHLESGLRTLLADVQSRLDAGLRDTWLSSDLARAGFAELVIRGDLDPQQSRSAAPAFARSTVVQSPGFLLRANFGLIQIYQIGTPKDMFDLMPVTAAIAANDSHAVSQLVSRGLSPHRAVLVGSDGARVTSDELRTVTGQTSTGAAIAPPSTDYIAFDARAGRRGCLQVTAHVDCDPTLVTAGPDSDALVRTVRVASSRTFIPIATVLLRGSQRVDDALNEKLPVQATASSSIADDPRVRPGAVLDADPYTTWTAAPDDPQPTLTLTMRATETLRGLTLRTDKGAHVSTPTQVRVEVGSTGSTVREAWSGTVPPDGRIRFSRPSVGRVMVIRILETGHRQSVSPVTYETRNLAAGIGTVTLQADPAVQVPDGPASITIGCDAGLALVIDSERIPLSVTAAPTTSVLGRDAVLATPCTTHSVTLSPGQHRFELTQTDWAYPQALTLLSDRGGVDTNTASSGLVRATSWTDTRRRLAVVTTDQSLLVIKENFNTGWRATINGRPLKSVRVDGWQQGYIVPGHTIADVTIVFRPQSIFALALGLQILALLVLLVWARPQRPHPPAVARSAPAADPRLPNAEPQGTTFRGAALALLVFARLRGHSKRVTS